MSLTERCAGQIAGVLSCFDRVVVTGTLVDIGHARSATRWLNARKVKIFDFHTYAKTWREDIRENAERQAAEAGLAIEFIRKANFGKEARVKEILRGRGTEPGLVHVFSAMESCPSFKPWHDKQAGKTYLKPDTGRYLHYYFYFIDEELGLGHLRIPTWAPYRLQFYFNAHNWLARRLDTEGIGYRLVDNAFVEIENFAKAQEIADGFDVRRLHGGRLEAFARRYCPAVAEFPGGYHWSLMQVEYATDIAFRRASDLAPRYDHLVRTATHAVRAPDVASFLGCRLDPRFGGELGTDFHTRIEGTRIKHYMGRVALKMYDKHGRVLRIETVANDVSFFKHHRRVEHRDGTNETKLAPVKKTIYSLGVLAELMGAANRRYLDFISALEDSSEGDRHLIRIARPVYDQNRSYRGLNFFEERDLGLILAVARGEFRIRGFQVRDLHRYLSGFTGAQISRMVKRLRMHGLVKKIHRTYRYHLTRLGHRVIAAGLRLREFCVVPGLAQTAA